MQCGWGCERELDKSGAELLLLLEQSLKVAVEAAGAGSLKRYRGHVKMMGTLSCGLLLSSIASICVRTHVGKACGGAGLVMIMASRRARRKASPGLCHDAYLDVWVRCGIAEVPPHGATFPCSFDGAPACAWQVRASPPR